MFVLPAIAFLLTTGLYLIALRLFPIWGLLDFPERYGLKRVRLPYPTGIVAVLCFLMLAAFLLPMDQKTIGMMTGVLLLAITSFIDDRTPLPSSLRLLIQLIVVTLIFATGSRIYTLTSPFGGIWKLDTFTLDVGFFGPLPVLGGIFTILWLLLTVNALNWFDGVRGQVSVITTIGFLMLGCLTLLRDHEPATALLSFSLAGIAGAGVMYDFPPGKMLLGDTGSMFFGLMLGLLGVYHGGKVATVFLALGIPLLDAVFVLLRRIADGRSPFAGGRDHLHHRLLAIGWPERKIVLMTAITGTLFGGTALFLNTAEKAVAGIILIFMITSLNVWIGRSSGSAPSEH